MLKHAMGVDASLRPQGALPPAPSMAPPGPPDTQRIPERLPEGRRRAHHRGRRAPVRPRHRRPPADAPTGARSAWRDAAAAGPSPRVAPPRLCGALPERAREDPADGAMLGAPARRRRSRRRAIQRAPRRRTGFLAPVPSAHPAPPRRRLAHRRGASSSSSPCWCWARSATGLAVRGLAPPRGARPRCPRSGAEMPREPFGLSGPAHRRAVPRRAADRRGRLQRRLPRHARGARRAHRHQVPQAHGDPRRRVDRDASRAASATRGASSTASGRATSTSCAAS